MRLYLSSFRIGNCPEELAALLRGATRTAIILNADDYKGVADREASLERERQELVAIGLDPVELDLRHYFGKQSDLRAELSRFDLVWVRGGNVFILRRAFHQSGADAVIRELLAVDGIVYGGYSAGIALLTPTLRGLDIVDEPDVVPPGYESALRWDGLGVLPYCILPHYKSDHPESARVDETLEYMVEHHLPFKALRDGQVIVRDGDREIVAG